MEPVLTKITWLPKDVYGYVVLIKNSWITKENHFRVSDYRSGLPNKGFSYFGILSLMNLFINSSRLRR